MKVISIVNQKGGVGKTVTTVNLAVGLANQGKKVLAIDLDPQGSLSISLGIDEPESIEDNIVNILDKIITKQEFDKSYAIRKHDENIDFISSDVQLTGLEHDIMGVLVARESILKKYIEIIKDDYDYIIIDCSPSLSMLTINALACSDKVIIPVQAHYIAMKGMDLLFETINTIKISGINKDLEVAGILITMFESRTLSSQSIIDAIQRKISKDILIFETKIPKSIQASEMGIYGISIYKYKPDGKLAIAYKSLIEELLLNC